MSNPESSPLTPEFHLGKSVTEIIQLVDHFENLFVPQKDITDDNWKPVVENGSDWRIKTNSTPQAYIFDLDPLAIALENCVYFHGYEDVIEDMVIVPYARCNFEERKAEHALIIMSKRQSRDLEKIVAKTIRRREKRNLGFNFFPRELVAAEVAVAGGISIDRLAEVEPVDNAGDR